MTDLFKRESGALRLAKEAGGGANFAIEFFRALALFAACELVIFAGAWLALIVFSPAFDTTDAALDFTSLFMQLPAIGILILYVKRIEKRSLASAGLMKEKKWLRAALGAGLGLFAVAAVALVGLAAGVWECGGLSPWLRPWQWVLLFFGFLIRAFFEEFFFRGVFLTSAARKTPLWIVMIVSSLLFALLHAGFGGFGAIFFLNTFLFGVFACLYAAREDGSVVGIALFHGIWDFAQGCLFGFHVAGSSRFATVWIFTQKGPAILGGSGYGPEGGLIVTAALLLGIGAVILFDLRARKKRDLSLF